MSAGPAHERDAADFLDRLISAISHELRTPLAVIVGYAELLSARDDELTRREAPRRILEAADRLSAMLDDILTVSALDSGAFEPEGDVVDLRELLELTVESLSRHEEQRSYSLSGASRPLVWADRDQVARVVSNLVRYARDASPHDGSVAIRVDEREGCAVISVADEGPGLSEEQRTRVFERVSLAERSKRGGAPEAGLGLHVAHRLVEQNGGSIAIESAPGKGAVVTFSLPLAEGDGS